MNSTEPHGVNGASSGNAEIKFHYSGKRQYSVIILCAVALLLLIAVTVTFAVILGRSAIVTSSSGRLSLVIGNRKGDNPFSPAASSAASPATTSSVGLNISDPPEVLSTSAVANDGVLSTREIAKRVRPSVVSILVSSAWQSGLASGIIMTEDGLIITNHHVVDGMTSITVVLSTGEQYDATLIGVDESSDLAVIRIEADGLQPATFGNSDAVEVGDPAVVVGTPYSLSLSGTTTQGIISAINRDLVIDNRTITLIQTDASINPGNSGGPLINQYGQVIGITSLKIGEEFEGLGFAIPMNSAKSILEELILYGHVRGKPALGISGRFLTGLEATANGLPTGLYVTDVYDAGSGSSSELAVGDVITKIDGIAITDLDAYNTVKNAHQVGDILTLLVYRDTNLYDRKPGVYLEVQVTVLDESLLTHSS